MITIMTKSNYIAFHFHSLEWRHIHSRHFHAVPCWQSHAVAGGVMVTTAGIVKDHKVTAVTTLHFDCRINYLPFAYKYNASVCDIMILLQQQLNKKLH